MCNATDRSDEKEKWITCIHVQLEVAVTEAVNRARAWLDGDDYVPGWKKKKTTKPHHLAYVGHVAFTETFLTKGERNVVPTAGMQTHSYG